jgi:tetratricopeptide (TPR) repeat protein
MVGMAVEISSADSGGKRRQGRRLPIPEAAKHDTEQPLGRDVADLAGIAATGRVVTKHDELACRDRRPGQVSCGRHHRAGQAIPRHGGHPLDHPFAAAGRPARRLRDPASVIVGFLENDDLAGSHISDPGAADQHAVTSGQRWLHARADHRDDRDPPSQGSREHGHRRQRPLTFASYAQAHVDDWIATHRTGLASARLLGDSTAELWILNNLGFGYIHAKRPQAAIDCLRECLPVVRETEDLAALARVLVNLGYALLDIDRDDEAMESLQESLLLFQQLGIRCGEGIALGGLGKAHRRRGQLGDAIAHYERTLDASREASDFVTEGTTLVELSAVRLELGQADAAIHTAMEAVDLYRQTGNRYGHAQAIAILGRAERDRGHPAQARQYWLDAIAIFTELGLPQADEVAASLNALESVSDRVGRPGQIHIVGPA